jgi:polyferredoxin
MVVANWFIGPEYPRFAKIAFEVQSTYGFVVGFVLAAAIGVGAYPILGTHIWCRFACPMAALLGLLQKLGRFHIRVKRDQCISCGNCSTYCEMGIDVRAYAQRNESFTRASCVGCGVCAHVCPRGVLKLENRSFRERKKLPMAS